jgi:hypothetical protein
MRELPVPVDFGNCDEDGAVRLTTRGTTEFLTSHGITVSDGLVIRMTDGELSAEGRCALRGSVWVARIERWVS